METISAKLKSAMSKSTKIQNDDRARYGQKLPTNRTEPQFFQDFPTPNETGHNLRQRKLPLNEYVNRQTAQQSPVSEPRTKRIQSYSSMTKYGKITQNTETKTKQRPLTLNVVTKTNPTRIQAPMKYHTAQCKYNYGQNLYYPHVKTTLPPTAGQQNMEEFKWECNLDQPNNACREGFGSQSQQSSTILQENTQEDCNCLTYPKEKVTYSPENGYKYIHKKGIKAFIKKNDMWFQENVHELLNPPAQAQNDNERIEQIWIHRGKQLTLKNVKQNCPNGYRIIAQFMPQTETGITFKIMREDTPLRKEMLQLEDEVPKCEWDAEYFKNLIIHIKDYDTFDLYSWTYNCGIIAFFHKAVASLKKNNKWIEESVEELLNRNKTPWRDSNKNKEEIWIHKGAHLDKEDLKKMCKNGCRLITQYMPDAKYSLVHKLINEATPLSLEMLRIRDEVPQTKWEKENYKNLKITVIDHDYKCQYSWSEETGTIMIWDLHANELEALTTHSGTIQRNETLMVTSTDTYLEAKDVELNTLTLDLPNGSNQFLRAVDQNFRTNTNQTNGNKSKPFKSIKMTPNVGHHNNIPELPNILNPPIGGAKGEIPTNQYDQREYQHNSERKRKRHELKMEELITNLPTPKEVERMIPNNPTNRGKLGQMMVLYQVYYQTRETQIMVYDQFKHSDVAPQMIQAIREIDKDLIDLANDIMDILEKQKHDEDEDYLDLPLFGNEHRFDMREIEGLPKFNPDTQKITLYQFWQKLSQFVKAKKLSEEATKSILAQTLEGIAFDIFNRNHEKSVKDIITQLRNRFGSFPTKASLLDQLSSFSRDFNEPIRSAMNRFEYLLHNIYKRDPRVNEIIERDCKQKVRDLAHQEAKIQLDRKEAISMAQGQTFSYIDRLNIIHMEEKLLRANGKLTQPSIQNMHLQEEELWERTYGQPDEEHYQAQWAADMEDQQSLTEESETESQDAYYPHFNQLQHEPYEEVANEDHDNYNQVPESETQNEYGTFSNQLQHYPDEHIQQNQSEQQIYRRDQPNHYHQTNHQEEFQAESLPSNNFIPIHDRFQPQITVSITMPDHQQSPEPQLEETSECNNNMNKIEYQLEESNTTQDYQDEHPQVNSSQLQTDNYSQKGYHQQFEAQEISDITTHKPITARQFLNGEEGTAIKLPNYDQINNISVNDNNKEIDEQRTPEEDTNDSLASLIGDVGEFVNRMNPGQDNSTIILQITNMLMDTINGK